MLLIILSALFSGLEAGLFSLSHVRIRQLVNSRRRGAAALEKLFEDPENLLSALLVGNTTVNIVLTVIWTSNVSYWYGLMGNAGIVTGLSSGWFFGLMSLVLLMIILIFGEVLPKVFFRTYAESATLALSWFVVLAVRFFSPVATAFKWLGKAILRIFGQKLEGQRGFVNKQTIMSLLDAGESEGTIHASEREMINSIFHFSDKLVKEVMVPRVDMIAWDLEDEVDKLLSIITRDGFSRVPVYEDSVDNVIGIVNAKDLFNLVSQAELSREDVMQAMRKPLFVPETKRIDELLKQFQRDKVHLAMVIDEYSGIAGLVTIEDIIEEIVGEIEDEFDPEADTSHYTELGEGLYRVDPRMGLDDFGRLVGRNVEHDDVDTVGGLLYSLFGKIPRQGEVIRMDEEGISFTVQRVRKNRIFEVLVRTGRTAGELS